MMVNNRRHNTDRTQCDKNVHKIIFEPVFIIEIKFLGLYFKTSVSDGPCHSL